MTTNRETEGGHEALLARAVGLLDRDAIIVANAGAGKTYLLVEHYFALLEAGLEPAQVVAFTFTEKAANELKERIVARLRTHPGFAALPDEVLRDYRAKILNGPIGTIHQYCLRIIEASRSAGERAAVKIVDEALESALQESVLRAYLRRRFEAEDPDALRLLRSFGIRDLGLILERYLAFLPMEPEEGLPLPPPEEEERALLEAVERLGGPLWEEIQAQKRALGWMSFADMERRALDLLQRPPETLKQFLQPVAHILVDEFQDTAPIQIRLVEALRAQGRAEGKRLRLFCVGDPKQSIYRFRDVDRNLLQKTEANILAGGGEKFDFVVNFRSTPEVLGLVNAFSRGAFPEARDSVAQRPSLAESLARLVEIRPEGDGEGAESYAEAEARRVAEAVASRRGETPLDRIAVLYRASSSAGPLIRELQARGIPYSVRGGQNLFERQEILDLHRLVYFLADPADDLSLVGVLRSPLFLLSDAALFFLCRRDPERGLWERLQEPEALETLEREFPREAAKAAWALARLRRLLALAETRSAHRLIEDWLRREDLGDLYAAAGGGPQALLAIEQWLDWLRALEEDHAPLRLADAARILREVSALQPNKTPLGDLVASRDSVQLMTIHAAKGLQFDTVFLIGANRRTHVDYPLLQRVGGSLALKLPETGTKKRKTERYDAIESHHREEDREESKRLLYVATTRAENRLFVTMDPEGARAGSLQDLLLECLGDSAEAWKGPLPPGPGLVAAPLAATPAPEEPAFQAAPRIRETSVSELETYFACPLKHHFAYARQVPTNPADLSDVAGATEIGTLLHAALNALHAAPGTGTREIVARLLAAQGREGDAELAGTLVASLDSYLAGPAAATLRGALEDYSELPFLLRLGAAALRGQIDRLLRREEGWVLVDFKYAGGAHSAEELLDNYGFQLKTYALAAERLLREPLRSVQIHVLNRAESHALSFRPEELAAHAELLETLAAQWAAGGADLEAVGLRPACLSCPYHRDLSLCPVPKGRPFRAA